MSSSEGTTNERAIVDMKLEGVVMPVSDVDRAKAFYRDPDGNGWVLQELTSRLPGR
jgi:hypothetical protein